MNKERNHELVETTLYRAAETIGDITGPVMKRYYERFPHAREMFEHHAGATIHTLEGEMVNQALYCLMSWYRSQAEVEIVLLNSVPHHADTLEVPPEAYRGLLQTTAEVIGDSIPGENVEELVAWRGLCDGLFAVIEQSRRYIHTPVHSARA